MPRTIEITAYTLDELPETIQRHVIDRMRDVAVQEEWWDYIYADLAEIGITCEEFDAAGYRPYCTLKFNRGAAEIAQKILVNHVEGCETYGDADRYLTRLQAAVARHSDSVHTDTIREADELVAEFRADLEQAYTRILREEYESTMSDEAVFELLREGEYEFDAAGNLLA